ncbi:MAG: glycoside hydrolase family 15 protein [archaeon]
MLVCLDKDARIRDFYYPHVGQENHVSGNVHRMGVWIDGSFSWISAEDWELSIKYKKDTLVSNIIAHNDKLKIKLTINEAVHPEKNIFLRKVQIESESEKKREVRIFFGQHFNISETNIGDTVYYNPILESIVHYKGKRYFLIGGKCCDKSFVDYATGIAGVRHMLGTFVDAEDGKLSKNSIEHGSVDSTIGFSVILKKNEVKQIDYWIAVGKKYKEICQLQKFIFNKTTDKLIKETEKHGINWLNRKETNFFKLDKKIQELFRRSLLIIKAQTDRCGAIIAGNDTHTFHQKRDTYSYMWPRDGALISRSLDKVGHYGTTNKFFNFCAKIISDEGYLFHKYRPDGSLGSSWHSWLRHNKLQIPIQEDETALVIDALWKHYSQHKDEKMIKSIYKLFIKKAGDFLYSFRDEKTGLPKESYDLWEEKIGVHTFTCATVYAGLEAASNFAKIFGSKSDVKKYQIAAQEVKKAIIKYLYDKKEGVFIKRIFYDAEGKIKKDLTIDTSTFYGIFEYKITDIDDPKLIRTTEKAIERLSNKSPCGGLARYENDYYYRISDNSPENPWFIPTMWFAEYNIAKATTIEELKFAESLLIWVTEKALPSGVLSEQLNPYNNEPLSVAPLTWSHAGFIIAVDKYLDKFEELTK